MFYILPTPALPCAMAEAGGHKKEGVSKVRDTLFFHFNPLTVNKLVNK